MSDELELTELADLKAGANELEQGLTGLIALGGVATDDSAQSAINHLRDAYAAIAEKRSTDARDALLRGQTALERLIDQRGVTWRLVNVHQLPLFGYHIAFFLMLIAAGTDCTDCKRFGVIPGAILADFVPTVALIAGGFGAELRAIWFLWNQTSQRIFYRRFLLSQLAAPFTGILLGMLAYLVAKAGLLAIGGEDSKGVTSVTVGELALCFFVGFKWEWALERIEGAFQRVGSGARAPEKPEPKNPNDPKPPKPEGIEVKKPKGSEPGKPEELEPKKPDEPQPRKQEGAETKVPYGADQSNTAR